jgi:hypothetical protein
LFPLETRSSWCPVWKNKFWNYERPCYYSQWNNVSLNYFIRVREIHVFSLLVKPVLHSWLAHVLLSRRSTMTLHTSFTFFLIFKYPWNRAPIEKEGKICTISFLWDLSVSYRLIGWGGSKIENTIIGIWVLSVVVPFIV